MKNRQQKILDSVLSVIPQEGWTERAYLQGVAQAGVSEAEARRDFPQGIADVAEAFHQWINDAMQERIAAKRNFTAMRVRDKVTFAVRARLEAIENNRDAMRRLLVWSLWLRNVKKASQALWQAAGAVWIAAGDTSSDYNYYTKRVLLIAVMKSVLSFWLNDESKDYQDTWAFLDRRISDVMVVGKGIHVIKTVGISDIVALVRSRFTA